jgi:hypothetical protein
MSTHAGRAWITAALAATLAASSALLSAAQEAPAPEKAEAAKTETVKTEKVKTEAPRVPAMRAPRPGDVTKVFVLRHVGAQGLAELLRVFPATITFASHGPIPNAAIGVSAAPAVMAAIEETVKRLDAPPAPRRSVELTGYVLEGLPQPVETAPLPAELEPVVAQLKRTFSYPAYRLLDTLVARATDGGDLEANLLGSGPADAHTGRPPEYTLRAQQVSVLATQDVPLVRLESLIFRGRMPILSPQHPEISSSPAGFSIRTDIEVRVGQRVVVGKSGAAEPGQTVFLVLSARLPE